MPKEGGDSRIFDGQETGLPLIRATEAGIRQNALHAWEALLYCLKEAEDFEDSGGNNMARLEVPVPVRDYLLRAAKDLLQIQRPGKDAAREVTRALGIVGEDFAHRGRDEWEGRIFYRVKKYRDQGMTWKQAVDRVEEELGLQGRLARSWKRISKPFRDELRLYGDDDVKRE